jgi:superfamily II DNA helicase RecQ
MNLKFDFENKKIAVDYPKSIKEVDEMSGEQFELFISRYMKEFQGFKSMITRKYDHGIDIVLWKQEAKNIRYGVQCKRFGPKTILGENELVKMLKGIEEHGISYRENGKPYLILFTSAEKNQVSLRGQQYIENEEIVAYYRTDIIEMIRDLDEKLNRNKNDANYSNIAFNSSKEKKTSFKENSKFVDMLKKERMNISKYNKISPVYLVYNDKTIEDIVLKKPTTINELLEVKGFDQKKTSIFGSYLINKIRVFLKLTPITASIDEPVINKEELAVFLKETRKKIAKYNKIDKLYNVFNNKTLEEIVEKIPKTKNELLEIKGIGPVKTELWGKYLIGEICKYLEKN